MATSKLITILFTDLVGSTDLAGRLGDEAADELRRTHFADLREAIETTGGTEVKTIGDAVMVSYEGAAEALAGAVAMQQVVDRRSRDAPETPLLMRVGISVGDASFEEGDWFGTPVIEASRLCAAADGEQILVSDLVRALAGSRSPTAITVLGERELKGLPEPVVVCEVDWPRAVDDRSADEALVVPLPSAVDTETAFPFAGRSVELEVLTTAWKQAAEAVRRAVMVSGEPGIGKTRLVSELVCNAHDDGAIVLWGRCDDELDAPYQPFAEALRHYVRAVPPERVGLELGPLGGELTRMLPELAQLVPGLAEPIRTDADTDRHRLFESVGDLLASMAEAAPVVLVLDDVHWADKPSLLLLRHILRGSAHLRLLILATYRDTDLDRSHPLADVLADLRRQSGVERLDLQGLDAGEVTSFMEMAAGHGLDEPGMALAEAVHHETEGNPFFVGEILRHLAESGLIVEQDGRWVGDDSLAEVGIPEGIREVVGRRLSRLSDATNAALSLGAVIGPEFDLRVIEAAGGPSGDELLDALDEAVGANVVQEVPDAFGRYRFAHALVRSTLYEELSTNRRLRMHWQIGEAIETRHATDIAEQLDQLAHHYTEGALAGDPAKAVEISRRAGDAAMEDLAFEAAARHYDRALGTQELATSPDAELTADLQIALTDALLKAGDSEGARTRGFAAAATARRTGDGERLAKAVLAMTATGTMSRAGNLDDDRISLLEEALDGLPDEPSGLRARLLSTLAVELQWSLEGERRRRLAAEALDMARATGDREALMAALLGGWTLIDGSTPFVESNSALVEEAAAHCDDPVSMLQISRSRAALAACRGERDAMERRHREAREIADALRQPRLIWTCLNDAATYSAFTGELARGEEEALAAFGYGQEHGVPEDMLMAAFGGVLYSLREGQGRLDELVPALQDLVASQPGMPLWRTALAGALASSDRADEAAEHVHFLVDDDFANVPLDVHFPVTMAGVAGLTRYVPLAEPILEGIYERLAPFVGTFNWSGLTIARPNDAGLGMVASQLGRYETADRHFTAAIELCVRAGAKVFEAQTRLLWVQSLRDRGDSAAARGQAELMRELAVTHGMDGRYGMLRRAEQLLA